MKASNPRPAPTRISWSGSSPATELIDFVIILFAAAMLVFAALLVWLIVTPAAHAEDVCAPSLGPRRVVVIRGQPFPSQIAIVVDASGSMQSGGYAHAVREAIAVASAMSDAGRVRFYAFADGVDEEPQGWIKLPDADAIARARSWFEGHGAYGNTNLVGALEHVLKLEESPLGVVVVTDAEPDGGHESAGAAIVALNSERAEPATIGVISINPEKGPADKMGAFIAKWTGGAYLRVQSR